MHNLLTLSKLIPFRLPCSPYTDYVHLFIDCENTSVDYIDFFANYAHNYEDCMNTLDD
jgi:hypothetical protein